MTSNEAMCGVLLGMRVLRLIRTEARLDDGFAPRCPVLPTPRRHFDAGLFGEAALKLAPIDTNPTRGPEFIKHGSSALAKKGTAGKVCHA